MTKTIHEIENNSQADHAKSLPIKEQENEKENEVFDLVLVDIKESGWTGIKCVKKNMHDPELKYICISYRWGELNEQQLKTPDYTAHITSFNLIDLIVFCNHIQKETHLKDIPYLWIDAISVDQQNHERKKDTILKMSQIYQQASYILAVPDFHFSYLLNNTANKELIYLIKDKYYKTIYNEILKNKQLDINDDEISISQCHSTSRQLIIDDEQYSIIQNSSFEKLLKKMEEIEMENKELKTKIKELKIGMKKEDKRKIYQFLAYLIEDWSNRAWVISEYQIAKKKYMNHGTPLKYMFITLLDLSLDEILFFSYHFDDDDDQQSTINNNKLIPDQVNDLILFNQFVKSRFMKRPHLELILNSNATQYQDLFNAILPSWNKHGHLIKDKNTVYDWKISDMTSVRLKLYEIMDLWDKATLLNACRYGKILPTFASEHQAYYLYIIEKVNYNNDEYKQFEKQLLRYINKKNEQEAIKIKQLMDEYKMNSKSIWNENLTRIQFDKHHCYLSVKSNSHFIMDEDSFNKDEYKNELSLEKDNEIHSVFIPFFTSNLPGYIDNLNICTKGSHIALIGNKKKNKWLLYDDRFYKYISGHFCTDDHTFNIY